MQDLVPIDPHNGQAVKLVLPGEPSPSAVWHAAIAQRRELNSQLESLRDQRNTLSENLREPVEGADRKGLEAQIANVDEQISAVQKRLASANEQVATAAAVPGAVVEEPPPTNGPPDEAYLLGALFMLVTLLPISIAYARRIWRRSAAAVSAVPQELMDRLIRLDQAVDSIAIEVERIGEGQRFVTRLMGERQPAEPLPVRRES